LKIIPFDNKEGTGIITIRFNSNGKTADKNVSIKVSGSGTGIDGISTDIREIYASNNTLIIKNCDNYRISIYNINGQKMKEIIVRGNDYSETLEPAKGIYILQGRNGAETISKKIIIR
jgi:hypothetical protein